MHTIILTAKYLTLAFVIFLTGCNSNSATRGAQEKSGENWIQFLMGKI